jgi:hypothetical protein
LPCDSCYWRNRFYRSTSRSTARNAGLRGEIITASFTKISKFTDWFTGSGCRIQPHDSRGLRAALKGINTVIHLAGTEALGVKSDLDGVVLMAPGHLLKHQEKLESTVFFI